MLLGVDVGGTFTDAALLVAGELHTAKVPTTPDDQARGVLAAIDAVLARAARRGEEVARFAHGMTVATNALLEGRGARTALIATEGFADVVELGRQARPSLYRLCEAQAAPLVAPELRFEAPERTGPQGPLRELEPVRGRELVELVAAAGVEAVAVVLLHSYADATHERLLGRLLAERLPGAHVSLSHEVVGTFREYERAATTELDAALSPLLAGYLRRLAAAAESADLPAPEVMQSSGGLAGAERAAAHAALTVLSGPAGGAGGAQLIAARAEVSNVLCFDMGGTSCDVCVIEAGRVRETAEREVGGRPLALPMLDIHTVGAGGGSIAWRDAGGALRVGPASAGAEPGPACYGRGGTEPTVTDANVVLGRLPTAALAAGISLDAARAQRAIGALARDVGLGVVACAEGIVRVANAEMLRALRVMTVARGVDPRDFALMPFGGAGPLHAAAIADELGIELILCPRACGVLSAVGLAAAAPRRDAARTVLLAGARLSAAAISDAAAELLAEVDSGLGAEVARRRLRYELRYRGQSFELGVDAGAQPDPAGLREAFEAAHEERYGYRDPDAAVELVTIRASAWGPAPDLRLRAPAGDPPPADTRTVVFDAREHEATVWHGELSPGTRLSGPAICALAEATVALPPGWHGEVDALGTIALRRQPSGP